MSDLGNKEVFSENLRYYMEIKNKDRSEACRDLNIKYTTFTDWYNGNKYPRIDKIELLADYFGIQKSDLIEKHDHEDEQRKFVENAKVALFGGSGEVTDAMWQEVINFAKYVKERERKKDENK